MENNPLPRLDDHTSDIIRQMLLPQCRLKCGEIWQDPFGRHRVGCIDAANPLQVKALMDGSQANLAIHDPPYNLIAFKHRSIDEYIHWCEAWIDLTYKSLLENSSFYCWFGADQTNGFQPLPDFMVMMRHFSGFQPRSFITMRNQRGYGTQHNWMAIRQELLYYIKGKPVFNVQYTDIPKILKGYYKKVGNKITNNTERSKSKFIRPGNVWVDIQQVFYRMQENVSGCYAQKPLKAIARIISASSNVSDLVIDWFAHSGTTLLACEQLDRKCITADYDPIYCEITIRRLEQFRKNGMLGWQNSNPFEITLPLSSLLTNSAS